MRIYNENEVHELLRKAAALQAAKRDFTTGLTLDEIRRAAEEAGIDPEFVEQAAMGAMLPAKEKSGKGFLGGPYTIDLERILEHEVDAEEWGEMVRHIREVYGPVGTISPVGTGFEWVHANNSYGSNSVYAHLSVTRHRGRTRIRATRKLVNESMVFLVPFLPLFFGIPLLFAAGAGKAPVFAPILFFLLSILLFFGARAGFGTLSRKEQQKMERLLTRFEQIAGESEAYEAEQTQEDASASRLDAGWLDEVAEDTSVRRRRRVR